ncbi:MAG: hypothetical protein JWP97_1767 [Labilithrix sp.]|nr:hypothetical protein [Labilithrix sp.]
MGSGHPAGSGHSRAARVDTARAPEDDGSAALHGSPVHDDPAHDAPEAVDFDALHAALGDPPGLGDALAPGDFDGPYPDAADPYGEPLEDEDAHDPREHAQVDWNDGAHDDDADTDDPGAVETEERIGESDGRSSAQYASSRPHTIPPSQLPSEDLNAPPVIVATEDTVPSAPPQMTVPLASRPMGHTPQSGVPIVQGAGLRPGSSPHVLAGAAPVGHPASAPHLRASQPGPVSSPQLLGEPAYPRGASQMTVRMADRPLAPAVGLHSRRGKVETLVVRPRGPSAKQKLFAFMAMLLLVTACGIAVIVWRKPAWIGLEGLTGPAATQAAPPVTRPAPPAAAGAAPSSR